MKKAPLGLIIIGILGIIFVCTVDIIMRKPVNDFTGPISTPALVACGIIIVIGFILLLRNKVSKK